MSKITGILMTALLAAPWGAARAGDVDARKQQLRSMAAERGFEAMEHRGRLILRLPADRMFNSGGTRINRDAVKELRDKLSPLLKAFPEDRFEVVGHADGQAMRSAKFPRDNLELSVARAAAVVRELASAGLDKERLVAAGAGDTDPIASNSNPAGRAKNRRVEIVFVPAMDSSGSQQAGMSAEGRLRALLAAWTAGDVETLEENLEKARDEMGVDASVSHKLALKGATSPSPEPKPKVKPKPKPKPKPKTAKVDEAKSGSTEVGAGSSTSEGSTEKSSQGQPEKKSQRVAKVDDGPTKREKAKKARSGGPDFSDDRIFRRAMLEQIQRKFGGRPGT